MQKRRPLTTNYHLQSYPLVPVNSAKYLYATIKLSFNDHIDTICMKTVDISVLASTQLTVLLISFCSVVTIDICFQISKVAKMYEECVEYVLHIPLGV